MRQIRNNCDSNEGRQIELRHFGTFSKIDGAFRFEPSDEFLSDTKLRLSENMASLPEIVRLLRFLFGFRRKKKVELLKLTFRLLLA